MGKFKMTEEEALAMVGTEFTYVYEDGDTIQAYVKKFDKDIGLTCITLETQTRDGWTGGIQTQKEDDGTFCVIGLDFRFSSMTLEDAYADLIQIRDSGKMCVRKLRGWKKDTLSIGGGASCAFMG